MAQSVQIAILHRALGLAGGITVLSRAIGLGGSRLLAYLERTEEIPGWLFLRLVDYVNEAERQEPSVPFAAHRHEGVSTKQ